MPAFSIPARILNVVGSFAAKGDRRPYVNGVHMVSDGAIIRLEATDGHKAIRWALVDPEKEPFDVIASVPKAPVKETLTVTVSNGAATISYGTTARELNTINAKYPDLDQIIPETDQDPEPAAFSPVLLSDAYRAVTELAKATGIATWAAPTRLRTFGERTAALITSTQLPEMTVVVMPMKD